ncbi:MAG: aminotransferase class I/II-fold pyridoxal phosphate-dependent enzyme [Polyangiales bacterium]
MSASLLHSVLERQGTWQDAGLERHIPVCHDTSATHRSVDGVRYLCLAANDYLGLAHDPQLRAQACVALRKYGLGGTASPLVVGSERVHRTAESALAAFVGQGAALLFASGYAANVSVLPALLPAGAQIFSDALNHASLIDGMRLCKAERHIYRHADPDALADLLARHRHPGVPAVVVTEAVFSMDGDLAPLADLASLANRYDCALMVDEAHALGVLGPEGRGLAAELRIPVDVVIGTLGKAFGLVGAFAAASPPLVHWLRQRARGYVYSTAVAPGLAATLPDAVGRVRTAAAERDRLRQHTRTLRAELSALGYCVADGDTPIIPVMLNTPEAAVHLATRLRHHGILVLPMRPPTVPEGTSRLRLVPSAAHEDAHIQQVITAFAALRSSAEHAMWA